METPKLEFDFNEAFTEYELSQIRAAMKQEAIAFKRWWNKNQPLDILHTTEELYNLYLESKKQKV